MNEVQSADLLQRPKTKAIIALGFSPGNVAGDVVRIVAATNRSNGNAPSHRVYLGRRRSGRLVEALPKRAATTSRSSSMIPRSTRLIYAKEGGAEANNEISDNLWAERLSSDPRLHVSTSKYA